MGEDLAGMGAGGALDYEENGFMEGQSPAMVQDPAMMTSEHQFDQALPVENNVVGAAEDDT